MISLSSRGGEFSGAQAGRNGQKELHAAHILTILNPNDGHDQHRHIIQGPPLVPAQRLIEQRVGDGPGDLVGGLMAGVWWITGRRMKLAAEAAANEKSSTEAGETKE